MRGGNEEDWGTKKNEKSLSRTIKGRAIKKRGPGWANPSTETPVDKTRGAAARRGAHGSAHN